VSTAQRRAREKALRKKAILVAAREVFFEQGISQATMEDVAARAEVSKGTIYLYFPSKESLLAHLLLEGLTLLQRDLRRARKRHAELPAAQQLRELAKAYLDFAQQRPDYFRLVMAFDRGRFQEQIPTTLSQHILSRSNRCLEVVSDVVQQGAEEGEFATSDPWLSAGIFWAGLSGVLVLFGSPVRRQMLKVDLEEMTQATCDLLISGLHSNSRQ